MTPTAEELDVPQEAESQTAVSDYGPDNEDLPQELIEVVRASIVELQGQEKFSRRREVLHDRRNRFYEQGFQHLTWNNGRGCFTMATPGGTVTTSDGRSTQCPTFIDDYNILFAFQDILTSVMTQNLPGVNFQPIDASDTEDIDKAKAAEDYSKAFDRMNDINMVQTEIFRMFALSGRVVTWVRDEEDGQRFGYEPDGSERTFQRVSTYGTLESKVPIMCKEFDKNFGYCFLYDDPDILYAKHCYPKFASQIKAGTSALGENAYERTARLGVLNGTRSTSQLGDSLTHLVSRANVFLRPSVFTGEQYEAEFEGGTIKDKLAELFPEGARFVFVGDTYVGSFAESMDDHIYVDFPYAGDGQFRKAIMDPMLIVQDNVNDMLNGSRENCDTGWGELWFNSEDEDLDAVRSQRSAPNAIRAFKCPTGSKIQDSIYQMKGMELPSTWVQFLEWLQGPFAQFLIGSPPALFGADDEHNETAKGLNQALNQSLGRLGNVWSRMKRIFARIRYQSALAASRNEAMSGKLTLPGSQGEENLIVNLDNLKRGNFGCYPDEDSSFPESTMQKRATWDKLVALAGVNPQFAQLIDNPDNVATGKRLWGLDELVLLPGEARNKQLAEIELLLQQEPIGWLGDEQLQQAQTVYDGAQEIAQRSGQPGPVVPPPNSLQTLKPSIPIDADFDYNQWEFEKCQEWLSSAAARDQEKRGNQAGVMNVKAHAMMHKQALMAQAMQQSALAPPAVAPGKHPPPGHAGQPKPPVAPAGPPPIPVM